MFGYIKISFDYTVNGVLSKKIETTTFSMNYYSDNWMRAVLEIIYLIIVIVKSKECIGLWITCMHLPGISELVHISL